MKKTTNEDSQGLDSISELEIEQQAEAIAHGLLEFCDNLQSKGIDPAVLNAVLLRVFCERMADEGDRQGFEELLEMAMEEPWDEHTLH
jgi:hypothetical protein